MKAIVTIFLMIFFSGLNAQTSKTEVMTLGTFHFNFPNLDAAQINKNDQIDVLAPGFQKEIETIVSKISRFRPTIIVIERQPSKQSYTDSIFSRISKGWLVGNLFC